ncbi:hypothetical protein GIB67_013680 [Kingdonia uniflora]|uniref:TF-B3 domain-containing protein n=1 Tax=Kingdonia uniflora TaxID=39325 RepID=A0A7J7NQC3_9MAGN|nr:hypothetical protein GIB67_013680 [Kingdonia uniflora]
MMETSQNTSSPSYNGVNEQWGAQIFDSDQPGTLKFEQNQQEEHVLLVGEKEYMFEKALTPSDVGKLNRLVIPKQFAERYFPLGGNGNDSSVESGVLLGFEDELGKIWKFRYSYWNSSQSYVLTKGWSRYVKEKKLDAGDIVSFDRLQFDNQRNFIRWRRRGTSPPSAPPQEQVLASSPAATGPWTPVSFSAPPYPSSQPYGFVHAGPDQISQNSSGNTKRLRLFGVNLECQLDEQGPFSSHGQAHFLYPNYGGGGSSSSNSHQESHYAEDVNQGRDGSGDLSM